MRDAVSVDGGMGDGSRLSLAAAPRPAARDQRPRRGRVRFLKFETLSTCPRHGRCCRCATDTAPLLFLVIAVPSWPSEVKGEEGTSNGGVVVEVFAGDERRRVKSFGRHRRTGFPLKQPPHRGRHSTGVRRMQPPTGGASGVVMMVRRGAGEDEVRGGNCEIGCV